MLPGEKMHINVLKIQHTQISHSQSSSYYNRPVMTVLLLYVAALLPVEGFLLYLSLEETDKRHQIEHINYSFGLVWRGVGKERQL